MSATIVEAVVKLATKVKGEAVKPANATIAAALDALAGENVQAKPTIADAIDTITANYGGGGGGGSTVTLDIMEVADAPLSTAYFTVENSSGTQLTITPVTEDEFHYFTITANAGELLTFRTVEDSGYSFSESTKYVMNEDQINQNTYPLYFEMTQVRIVAANDPSAVAPHPYLMLALGATH